MKKILLSTSIAITLALSMPSICKAQKVAKKIEGHSIFEVTDTAATMDGKIHSLFKNNSENHGILIDGVDIQGVDMSDSTFANSEMFLMNLGGTLHIGNSDEEIKVEGTMDVDSIKFEDRGYQIHPSGEIAFGNISKGLLSPSVVSGTGNFSVSWNSVSEEYDITFDEYTYNRDDFTTVVTPRGTNVHHWRANGSPGELNVTFFDSSGNKIQSSFQFVTYYFVPSRSVGEIFLLRDKELERR